ncbi:hypothetical protein T492DRAFT_996945 [Pavlovales sp. CCMP2436]|nr:hypothetical protein T492DRAFT_996945 [Pavlovales sp. CCMP2436]
MRGYAAVVAAAAIIGKATAAARQQRQRQPASVEHGGGTTARMAGSVGDASAVEWADSLLSPEAALSNLYESVTTWTGRLRVAEELTACLILGTVVLLILQLLFRSVSSPRSSRVATARGGSPGASARGRSAGSTVGAHSGVEAGSAEAGVAEDLAALDTPGLDLSAEGPQTIPEEPEEEDATAEEVEVEERQELIPPTPPPRAPAASTAAAVRSVGRLTPRQGSPALVSPAAANAGISTSPPGVVNSTYATNYSGRTLSRSALKAHTAVYGREEGPSPPSEGGRRSSLLREPSELNSIGSRNSRVSHKTATSEAVREGMRRRPNDPFDNAVLRTAMLGSPVKPQIPLLSPTGNLKAGTGARRTLGGMLSPLSPRSP